MVIVQTGFEFSLKRWVAAAQQTRTYWAFVHISKLVWGIHVVLQTEADIESGPALLPRSTFAHMRSSQGECMEPSICLAKGEQYVVAYSAPSEVLLVTCNPCAGFYFGNVC